MTTALNIPVPVPDNERPQWIHGELAGVANAPGVPDSVRELVARHTSTFFAWQAATHAARSAEAGVEHATKVDAQARARGLASNRPAAKPQLPDAIVACNEARQHETDLLRAVRLIEDDLRSDIAAHTPEWVAVIDDDIARLRADVTKMVDDARAALLRIAQLDKVRVQVAHPHAPKVWSSFDMSVPGIAVDHRLADALATVRNAVSPPTPLTAVPDGNYDALPVKVFG